jgi:hypothetical protein
MGQRIGGQRLRQPPFTLAHHLGSGSDCRGLGQRRPQLRPRSRGGHAPPAGACSPGGALGTGAAAHKHTPGCPLPTSTLVLL